MNRVPWGSAIGMGRCLAGGISRDEAGAGKRCWLGTTSLSRELQPLGRGARLQAAIELTVLRCNYRQRVCPQPCRAVEGESALPAAAAGLWCACGVGVLSLQPCERQRRKD